MAGVLLPPCGCSGAMLGGSGRGRSSETRTGLQSGQFEPSASLAQCDTGRSLPASGPQFPHGSRWRRDLGRAGERMGITMPSLV